MTSSIDEEWRSRFFSFWIGQQFSLFGSSIVMFALSWWLAEETGSATILASSLLVEILPSVLLQVVAGPIIDRHSRKIIMILADGAIAAASAALGLLFWTGSIQIWQIYAAMVVRGIGETFHGPAQAASVSLMVPEQHLARIAGLDRVMQGATRIITPPIGALLVSFLPMYLVLGVDVVTAAIAIAILLFISIPGVVPSRNSYVGDIREGFRYILEWRGLFLLLISAAFLNFLATPAFSLLPLLVKDHFGKGAIELGWLDSSAGLGLLLGGSALSAWGGFRRRMRTATLGLAGMGVGILTIGILPPEWLSATILAMFVFGFMNCLTNGPLQAMEQAIVRAEMQGRLFSLGSALSMGMIPLGLAVAGPVADAFGIQIWYVMSGTFSIIIAMLWLSLPSIRLIEEKR
jgi:DHA3 family macrolide efflux protein-like MFS transporter